MSALAAYGHSAWKYDLKDGHPDTGLTLEEWRASLAAEGREPEVSELAEGAEMRLEGRTVRRHAVRRWVPDRSAPNRTQPPLARRAKSESPVRRFRRHSILQRSKLNTVADGSDRSNTRGVVVIALTGLLSTVGAAFLGGAFANSAVHDQLVIARENTIKDQRRQIYVDFLRATAKACEAAGNGDPKAANAAAVEVLNQQGRVLLIAGPAMRTAVNNFSNQLMETKPAPGDQNPCELPGYRKLRDAFVTAATPEIQE